jgi:prepilin-type N-terminal cleavage/methylation domain-containing protein
MLHCNAHKKDKGFTLVELLVVVIIVGILSALAIPSFIGLLRQNEIKEAVGQVEGALKEAQRQAIKMSRSCALKIVSNNINGQSNPVFSIGVANATPNCSISTRTLKQNMIIATNANLNNGINFSFKGNTANASTIVVYSNQAVESRKCIVISGGLGIIQTGNYQDGAALPDPNDVNNNSANNCNSI